MDQSTHFSSPSMRVAPSHLISRLDQRLTQHLQETTPWHGNYVIHLHPQFAMFNTLITQSSMHVIHQQASLPQL
jgi:hypothetical protein